MELLELKNCQPSAQAGALLVSWLIKFSASIEED